MTEPLFRTDAYLRQCEGRVLAYTDTGGLILDRSIFYPHGGGQPGDSGKLVWEGVLSVPDRDSDGAAWALMNQQGQLVARPMVAFPAGDSVAGLVGGYPLAGLTAWGLLLLAYVATLIALSRTRPK